MAATNLARDHFRSSALGQVWSITIDPARPRQLQERSSVRGMLQEARRVTIRVIRRSKPIEGAIQVEPTLEDAYLLKVGTKEMEVLTG